MCHCNRQEIIEKSTQAVCLFRKECLMLVFINILNHPIFSKADKTSTEKRKRSLNKNCNCAAVVTEVYIYFFFTLKKTSLALYAIQFFNTCYS